MELNREKLNLPKYPERIIQFGEGNFLRCFADWQIDILNKEANFNSGVAVVRPINYDTVPLLNTQDGLYTAIIRGINEKGEVVKDYRIISSVNREIPVYKEFDEYLKLAHNPEMRFIISNTTEAGLFTVIKISTKIDLKILIQLNLQDFFMKDLQFLMEICQKDLS